MNGQLLTNAGSAILELILPGRCLCCDEPQSSHPFLCEFCLEQLKPIEGPTCKECGRPVGRFSDRENRCAECKRHPHAFTQASAPLQYTSVVRDSLLQLKFARRPLVAEFFGEILANHLARLYWLTLVDIVVPAPMHWFKRMVRGYNQAELLAERVSRTLNIPLVRAINKTRDTAPQLRLARSQRLQNLDGAFRIPRPEEIAGKKILLVDDVITTGTTCSECARILLEAGADSVYALAVARALMRNPDATIRDETEKSEPVPF